MLREPNLDDKLKCIEHLLSGGGVLSSFPSDPSDRRLTGWGGFRRECCSRSRTVSRVRTADRIDLSSLRLNCLLEEVDSCPCCSPYLIPTQFHLSASLAKAERKGLRAKQRAKGVRTKQSFALRPLPFAFTYFSTMSFFKLVTNDSTSPFSFSGALNLSSEAIRCFAAASQSAFVIPKPEWLIFMSRPV